MPLLRFHCTKLWNKEVVKSLRIKYLVNPPCQCGKYKITISRINVPEGTTASYFKKNDTAV